MLLLVFACLMVVPLLVSLFYGVEPAGRALYSGAMLQNPLQDGLVRHERTAFGIAIAVSALAGLALRVLCRGSQARDLSVRDGFAVVTLAWITLAAMGAVPFCLAGRLGDAGSASPTFAFRSYTNCYFETISGLTTTGSSILEDVESLPNGLLFWRSFTHWIGGMGIVVLAVAIFPALGIGGYQLYRAETSGVSRERLSPRIAESAKLLWGVYLLLTVVLVLLLLPRMSLFDALCQTFGTVATGGFSTRNASIGGFGSFYVEMVVMVFTFISGISFVLHYQAFRGNFAPLLKDKQAQFLSASILISIVLVTASVYLVKPARSPGSVLGRGTIEQQAEEEQHIEEQRRKVDSLPGALRYAAFQVVTINCTCGFGTADFDLWPNFTRFLLVTLMFCGASAGSTSGSLKCIRVILLLKMARREIDKMIRPRAVLPVKLGGEVVDDEALRNVMGLFILYLLIFALATVIMTWFLPDLESAFSSVACTMGGVGPGLSTVGPARTFAGVATPGKWVLSACMLLGRLEIYSIVLLLSSRTWKR